MTLNKKWHILQLFAGEGTGGTGTAGGEGNAAGVAETGAGNADAGHQRLLELGVPADKIRKPKAKKASPLPDGAIRTEPKAQNPQVQVAAAEEPKAQTEAPPRLTWDEVKKDPEYNAEIQKIVKTRLKEEGKNKALLATLEPALKHLATQHGLDPDNLDHTALVKAITGEYESKALELGVSTETAMKLDQKQRTMEAQQQNLEKQAMQNHMNRMIQQGEALQSVIPSFNLQKELENPTFMRLVSPTVGLSVEDAFYAVHRKEMQAQSMKAAAEQAQQMISNSIASGTRRPDESGTTAQAPSVSKFDYKNATPAQRKALKEAIYKAAAEGRKIYPG